MDRKEVFSGEVTLGAKEFFFKVLTGSAQGILIGVLPSAVMKYILQYSGAMSTSWGQDFSAILTLFQVLIPALIGFAIAAQFAMPIIDAGAVALATTAASGSIKWLMKGDNPITHKSASPLFVAGGAGDVINAMLVAAIAVIFLWLIKRYLFGFGSVAIILTPIIVGGGVGLIGKEIAPYVSQFTGAIGQLVETFTKLAPLPMSILIAAAFSIIIITPISTVGVALAISLAGLGAGSAAMGVVATTVVLLINSWSVNNKGVTLAIFLGAMKGMMPSVFKKPQMMIAFILTAGISAVPVWAFNIQGTPTTAGFGWIGMVAPIQSMIADQASKQYMSTFISPLIALVAWFIVPILSALVVNFILTKIVHLYTAEDFRQEM